MNRIFNTLIQASDDTVHDCFRNDLEILRLQTLEEEQNE